MLQIVAKNELKLDLPLDSAPTSTYTYDASNHFPTRLMDGATIVTTKSAGGSGANGGVVPIGRVAGLVLSGRTVSSGLAASSVPISFLVLSEGSCGEGAGALPRGCREQCCAPPTPPAR